MKKNYVSALGEILIDFTYAGVSENGVALFEQNPGGAPANVLAAVQKLGGTSAFIGKVGTDMHGEFLKQTLENANISTDGLVTDENYFTTLAFVNLSPSGERSFSFARKPGADTMLNKDEVNYDIIKNSEIFHLGSLSLTDEPAKSATISALEFAKEKGVTISYDPNYRAMLWKDKQTAINGMRSILGYVDVIKISDEEIEILTDTKTPEDAARELLDIGIKCVIITLGSKGAYVATKDCAVFSSTYEATVVDTTGAGDSFMGGFLYKMVKSGKKADDLTYDDVVKYSDFANAVASLCVTKRGAIGAMPDLKSVEDFMKNTKKTSL